MAYNPPTQSIVDNDTRNTPSNEAIFEALKSKADTNLQNLSFSGSNGQFLTLSGGVPAWAALPASGANTTLSNLQSPTAINQNLNMGTNQLRFNSAARTSSISIDTLADVATGINAVTPSNSGTTTINTSSDISSVLQIGDVIYLTGLTQRATVLTKPSTTQITVSPALGTGGGGSSRQINVEPQAISVFNSTENRFRVTKDGKIYARVGTNSLVIGDENTISDGTRSIAIGRIATTATSNFSTAVGDSAQATGAESSAFGILAKATGNVSIAIGGESQATGTNGIAIGYTGIATTGIAIGNGTSAVSGIALGHSSVSAANTLAIGSNSMVINTVYIGRGATDLTAVYPPVTVTTTVARDINTSAAAATLTLAGSRSTGNQVGSDVYIATAPAGASGSTLNAHVNRVQVTGTGDVKVLTGQLTVETAGKGLSIKEGSNAKMGTATMVAGTVTVSTTAVTANSRIFLTIQSLGTVASPKAIAVTARSANTSFTITSADNTDTSVVAWMLVEPA